MTIRVASIEEARALVAAGHSLVDVRSEPEFEEGRAAGAVNVPWRRMGATGIEPNPNFVHDVRQRFGADAKLVVYCKALGRARSAADALVRAGFAEVVVMHGGFDGVRDHFGRVVAPGWGRLGLPVESG